MIKDDLSKLTLRHIRTLLIPLLFCLLTACGFTAHPINYLSPQLHKIYFQADDPYDFFTIELKNNLQNAGATLFDQPNKITKYHLHLSATNFTAVETSINISTQARVYTLLLEVSFSLTPTKGATQKIATSQKISTTRNITLAPNELFATSNQVPITKEEMRQELIIKIMNILSSNLN